MSTKELHHHTGGFGMAMGLPIADAIEQLTTSARVLDACAEKMSREREQDFGSQIADAVKRKSPCHVATAAPRKDDDEDDDNDSFAESLKKAIQRKPGQKQHKEQTER